MVAEVSPAMGSDLSAILRLDQERYETGQPILAFVALVNKGSQRFKDLAYMDPGAGFLQVHVQGKAGELRSYGYRDTWLYFEEGIELEPSGCACETLDLIDWFGTHADTLNAGDPATMPAGMYSAWAVVKANLGVRAGDHVVVRSNTVSFRIVDSSQGSPSHRVPTASIKPDGLAKSPDAFFLSGAIGEDRLATGDIVKALQAAGRSPILAAAIVDRRIKARIQGDSAKRGWLRSLGALSPDYEVRCVIETWGRKLSQRKYYHSYGD